MAFCFCLTCSCLTFPASPAVAREVELSLDQALRLAQENSPRLARLSAMGEAARAARRGASAAGLPRLDWTGGYTRYSEVPEFAIRLPGTTEPTVLFPDIPDAYRSRFSLTLPLFTGGRVSGLVRAARREEQAAGEDLAGGRADLALETATAYWDLVTAREREQVLDEALAAYAAHLRDAENRHAMGLAARNEVLSVQVERDRAELSRLSAEGARTNVQANLGRLLGLAPEDTVRPAQSLEGARTDTAGTDASGTAASEARLRDSLEARIRTALGSRPERAALSARVAAAQARTGAERAARWPQVSASAGYDYANPNRRITPPVERWDDSWDAGVQVSLSLFDSGRIAASAQRAAAEARALQEALNELDAGIRLEVTSRWIELRTARAAVRTATSAWEAASENRKVVDDRYQAGVVTSAELLDAEVVLLRAGLERTDALARVRLAAIALERASGSLRP